MICVEKNFELEINAQLTYKPHSSASILHILQHFLVDALVYGTALTLMYLIRVAADIAIVLRFEH